MARVTGAEFTGQVGVLALQRGAALVLRLQVGLVKPISLGQPFAFGGEVSQHPVAMIGVQRPSAQGTGSGLDGRHHLHLVLNCLPLGLQPLQLVPDACRALAELTQFGRDDVSASLLLGQVRQDHLRLG